MKKVIVPLAEGFEEIEAITIIDVLRRAGVPVEVVSITGTREVTGSHKIKVIADELVENIDPEAVEMVILPGGMPGSMNLAANKLLNNLIVQLYRSGRPIGAICAAPLVLGQLGILDKKEATCYPGFEKYLAGATISSESVVESGNIITGKGAGLAIPFALKIVELLKGKQVADELIVKMIVNH